MKHCCAARGQSDTPTARQVSPAADTQCAKCGGKGSGVERKTVLHHVLPALLNRVNDEVYRFCPDPGCALVYYGDGGTHFTVKDVRELVTVKASGDERPICYCFGFNEGEARREIARTGTSSIPAQISGLIKARMCACEVRNPSGACCLGLATQTVKCLSEEHKASARELRARRQGRDYTKPRTAIIQDCKFSPLVNY
ncbi:MAG: putative iron-sulfur cluster-binding metallochaperone [Acidobacteriota bacterium]